MKKKISSLAGMLVCLLCFVVLLPENVIAKEEKTEVSSLIISHEGQQYGELYGAPYSKTDDSDWLTLRMGGRGLRIVDDNNTDIVLIDQFGSVYIGGVLCNPGQMEEQENIVAYIRQYEEESWFMIFNFQEKSQKIKIPERLRNEKMNLLMSNYNKNDQEIMKPYEGRIYMLS